MHEVFIIDLDTNMVVEKHIHMTDKEFADLKLHMDAAKVFGHNWIAVENRAQNMVFDHNVLRD